VVAVSRRRGPDSGARSAFRAGAVEYRPIGLWKSYTVPDGFTSHPDMSLAPVSPLVRHGYYTLDLATGSQTPRLRVEARLRLNRRRP